MKLTVLGCSTPFPRPDFPCSGYLISSKECNVLLDCGPGVFAALLEHTDPHHLSAVWISHMHPDHSGDLAALANWALNTAGAPKIPVFGPANWDVRLNRFISEDEEADLVGRVFDVGYLEDGATISVRGLDLTSRLVHHSVPAYGARISDGVNTFAYSGDSGICVALDELARNADVFLCEAGSNVPVDYHMTAQQAREVAQRANVKKLIITHVPDGVVVDETADQSISSDIAYPEGEWLITK